MENAAATLGNSLAIPQLVKQSYSMTQQLHLGTYSTEMKTMPHRLWHTTFRAAFFKIAKRWR